MYVQVSPVFFMFFLRTEQVCEQQQHSSVQILGAVLALTSLKMSSARQVLSSGGISSPSAVVIALPGHERVCAQQSVEIEGRRQCDSGSWG